ncbi:DUF4350 domain-containing protein [Silanimonas algicola]
MSPLPRNLAVGALLLAVVGLGIGAFLATHERITVEQPTPPTAEARANPLHGLALALREAGQDVVLKGHVDVRRTPPPPRGTLVLLYPEAQVETEDDSWALLDWVGQGGRLVLPMPSGDAAPSLSTMLGEGLGVEALRGAAAEVDCPRLRLADGITGVVCGTPFAVTDHAEGALLWPKAGHARLARLPYGEGEVLVLSDLDAFANHHLYPVGSVGDTEADAEREQRRDAQTRLMAQLAGDWLDGDAVWLLSHRGGSLTALLWREGWPVMLGLALALLAWLRWASQRLGPTVPAPSAHRRALMEHIDAAGQFAFRNDHGASLHAALREAVLERLAQRHALAGLDEAALARALADRSRVPVDTIAAALALPHRATPDRFREAVATLATLLHRL